MMTVEAMIAEIRELCASRQADCVDGSRTDVDAIWPSEILAILDRAEMI